MISFSFYAGYLLPKEAIISCEEPPADSHDLAAEGSAELIAALMPYALRALDELAAGGLPDRMWPTALAQVYLLYSMLHPETPEQTKLQGMRRINTETADIFETVGVLDSMDASPAKLLEWLSAPMADELAMSHAVHTFLSRPKTRRQKAADINSLHEAVRSKIADSRELLLCGCLGPDGARELLIKLQALGFHGRITIVDSNHNTIEMLRLCCDHMHWEETYGIALNLLDADITAWSVDETISVPCVTEKGFMVPPQFFDIAMADIIGPFMSMDQLAQLLQLSCALQPDALWLISDLETRGDTAVPHVTQASKNEDEISKLYADFAIWFKQPFNVELPNKLLLALQNHMYSGKAQLNRPAKQIIAHYINTLLGGDNAFHPFECVSITQSPYVPDHQDPTRVFRYLLMGTAEFLKKYWHQPNPDSHTQPHVSDLFPHAGLPLQRHHRTQQYAVMQITNQALRNEGQLVPVICQGNGH